MRLKFASKNRVDGQHVLLNGNDVTDAIRSPEVTNTVSIPAKHRLVREEMVKKGSECSVRAVVL
ncbi:hypothetical protein GCM10020331_068060 [Ectobacillus funiculus]